MAGDERTACTREQQSCGDKFLGFAKAVHRRVAHDLRHAVRREHFLVLLGGEEAGHQGVHTDSKRCPFTGQVLAEIVHRPFGHGIGEHAAQRQQAGHGTEIDDGGRDLVIHEVFAKHLAGEKHALGVDVHDPVVFLFWNVEERRGGVHASTIDEDVAATGALQHLIQQDLQVCFAAGVSGNEVGLTACGLNGLQTFVGLGLVPPDEHDLRTRRCITFCDGAAEFACAADHDSGFALKREEFENGGHGERRIYGVSSRRRKQAVSPLSSS